MHPKVLKVFWGLKVRGVVHAGAHKGEELQAYEALEFGPVTWIEAIPDLAEELANRVRPPSKVINAAVWSVSNEKLRLKVTSSSASSSLFDLQDHKNEYPEIGVVKEIEVISQTLDDLDLGPGRNLLVLDLQGAEYEALSGASRSLQSIDYIVTEVNRKMLYKGIALVGDLDQILQSKNFTRVATRWTRHGWGEALYLRPSDREMGVLGPIRLQSKILLYWCWLHFVEIPVVYLRSRSKPLFANRSKARSRRWFP